MRSAVVSLIAGLGFLVAAASANAAAPVAGFAADRAAIVQVADGCGWGFYPVGGHWNRWGQWMPPHCAPIPGHGFYPDRHWEHGRFGY